MTKSLPTMWPMKSAASVVVTSAIVLRVWSRFPFTTQAIIFVVTLTYIAFRHFRRCSAGRLDIRFSIRQFMVLASCVTIACYCGFIVDVAFLCGLWACLELLSKTQVVTKVRTTTHLIAWSTGVFFLIVSALPPDGVFGYLTERSAIRGIVSFGFNFGAEIGYWILNWISRPHLAIEITRLETIGMWLNAGFGLSLGYGTAFVARWSLTREWNTQSHANNTMNAEPANTRFKNGRSTAPENQLDERANMANENQPNEQEKPPTPDV